MVRNLLSCVLKDLRLFGRSKVSALVTIVVPLLIVLLVGTAFSSTSLQGVKIGVYSSSYNELTESILLSFSEQSFSVEKLDSLQSCIDSVKRGNSQICVVFPPDLSPEGNTEAVTFHVDHSRINLAYLLINDIKSKVSSKSSELGLALVEELISALKETKNSLPNQKTDLENTITDVSEIKEQATTVSSSFPDLDDALSRLGDAKNLAEQLDDTDSTVTELRSKINLAISEINSIETEITSLSSDVDKIEENSEVIRILLSNIVSNIDSLIEKLNNVKVTEAEKIVFPIKTEIESVNVSSLSSNFLFPSLFALMMLFGSTLLASVIVLRERKTKAYFRNFITPTSDFTFVIGMYLAVLLILIVQVAVLFSGLIFVSDIILFDILGNLSLIIFLSATTFIFMGMLIGYVFRSEETVILVSISIIASLIFFSNTILPIETIVSGFQILASYNPLVISDSLLKKTILFKSELKLLIPEILILAVFSFIFIFLTLAARKLTKRLL